MSFRAAIVMSAPLLLALSACGDEGDIDVENDGREASGEVLEGSISDAMLPVDQVRSQAPLAAPEETASPAAAPADAPAQAPLEAAVETPAEAPGPAAEPVAAD